MPRHAHRKDGTAVYSDDEDEYIYRTNYIWKRRQVKRSVSVSVETRRSD